MKTVFSVAAMVVGLLLSSQTLAGPHMHPQGVEAQATVQAKIVSAAPVAADKVEIVRFQLTNAKGKPLTETDFQVVHTKPIHVLIVDPALQDFHHLHPISDKPGEFVVKFKPKLSTDYGIWIDVTPRNGMQQFVRLTLKGSTLSYVAVSGEESLKQKVNGYSFKLSFNATRLKVGDSVMGTINVTDPYGKPYLDLQPVLGAFAHVVGFYDDFKTVAHMHPLGVAPRSDKAHSGPKIIFHFTPEKAGFVKLFAQFKIEDKDVFVPFGVIVEK